MTPKRTDSSTDTASGADPNAESSDVDQETGVARTRGSGATSVADRDLLRAYLAEVRKHSVLSAEEEKQIAIHYVETKDPQAAERLVTANLRLVVKLAFQYHRQWANVLDLIQEGNVGLVHALSGYDPYKGVRFSSYAQYWIRAMILRFLMDNYRMVRLGSTRAGRKLFFQLHKERERLLAEGIQPTTRLLAERLDVAEKEVIAIDQHLRAPALSLEAPAAGEEGRALGDLVPDEDGIDPSEQAARNQLGAVIRKQLATFRASLKDEREQIIWDERLVSPDPRSLSQLGKRFGVSKERIRQIDARIRKRLKAQLENELGDEINFEFDLSEED